jgi:hypothetical protein
LLLYYSQVIKLPSLSHSATSFLLV